MRPELCKAGHPLTPENTYKNGRGGVYCKICKRIGGKNAYVQWVGIQMYGWNLRSQRDWYQKDAAPVEPTDFFKTETDNANRSKTTLEHHREALSGGLRLL